MEEKEGRKEGRKDWRKREEGRGEWRKSEERRKGGFAFTHGRYMVVKPERTLLYPLGDGRYVHPL
jgi:hypothetical protein